MRSLARARAESLDGAVAERYEAGEGERRALRSSVGTIESAIVRQIAKLGDALRDQKKTDAELAQVGKRIVNRRSEREASRLVAAATPGGAEGDDADAAAAPPGIDSAAAREILASTSGAAVRALSGLFGSKDEK